MASTKKITLKSSDHEIFDVDEAVALQSEVIKYMIEDDCADNGIPLPYVTGKILAKVIEFCKKHIDRSTKEELKKWDTEFVKVDPDVLFGLILAANYLNIKSLLDFLLDFTCQTVADKIKGRTPDEIRKTFNIELPIPKKISLKSSDDEIFVIDEAVALQSVTIKHMIEDDCADNVIPLPNVTGKILAKVIEFCKNHVARPNDADDQSTKEELKKWVTELVNNDQGMLFDLILAFCKKPVEMPNDADDQSTEEELKNWDTEFVKVDQGVLFDLILAANYLNIHSLLDLTCLTVANMIKGKTPEEIRKTFNIVNDFTPEEEEEEEYVWRENQWAFE